MLGTLIYPTVWFSDEPKFVPPKPEGLSPIFLETELGGHQTWFLQNANVIVDTDERRTAAEILNCYFLCHTLLLHPVLPITETELYIARWTAPTQSIIPSHEKVATPRNIMSFLPETRPKLEFVTTVHSRRQLEVVLEEAQLVCGARHKTGMLVFYEAWDAIQHGSYSSGVIMGWTAIEVMLDAELKEYLVEQGAVPDVASKIAQQLTAYQVLNLLTDEARAGRFTESSAPSRFSLDQLNEADRIRRVRNDIVHEGKQPTADEAAKFRELANQAMWRFFRLSGIEHNTYIQRIQDAAA